MVFLKVKGIFYNSARLLLYRHCSFVLPLQKKKSSAFSGKPTQKKEQDSSFKLASFKQ